ncbi:MAG: peptidase S10 [Vicinamibacteria bacterium]|nr:peptidase S10 [Vicinamibacteria bacterium]
MSPVASLLPLLLLFAPAPQAPTPAATPAEKAERAWRGPAEPVVTRHELKTGDKVLRYSVTTGLMPLRNEQGEVEAEIFFMAYVADRPGGAAQRPLMFSFNGGPGSASVWLHLGALGPRRVKMQPDGAMPAPPYELVDNPHNWLEFTDLVFIDPVGTGYSRATRPELGKKFWGLQGDLDSVGEFIRLYLGRHERWASPLFLVGESYGTTRAAGLAGHLVERGIAFNGVLLVSSILNFQTARFTKGNDLPYVLFLPTYTATAWYHKQLPADLQAKPVAEVLKEVRAFAEGDYQEALARGDRLQGDARAAIRAQLARFTGLSPAYLEETDLRIQIQRFCKELMRDEKRTVGRLDSRFQGIDALAATDTPDFDPSMAAIRPPYTAAFNDYVRRSLGYKSDLHYYILGGGIGQPWDFGNASQGFPDTSEALRSAFSKNPSMRVFVASGYYDLATPFFATEYTLAHMGLDPSQRARIETAEYESGHMMYIHEQELADLRRDVEAFVKKALAK